ncbi:DMT family transporter [Aggregatibacter actinomycetemcomitans]|uniref:DMT family transporter n=1 Tax=Aggregatibacter actinomycetemcomitans TaxID=714 RepID=UPI00197BAF36|nr:DMT family transporter [Aggregatibacter actinomycetemcomitans]MBN6070502.1 DMT family transporter [Aggregatibacter actinomycetemcomitans]
MQQQPLAGFLLVLTAVCMWGALPIALQQVVAVMDAQTIVWYRFITSAIGLFILLGLRKTLPKPTALRQRYLILIMLGILGLSANFFLFNLALNYIPPTSSQVLSPLSSFIMLFFGVFVFKEQIGLHQKIGLVILILGLILFFNQRFGDFLQLNDYFKGIVIALCASFCWVAYGMAQKLMLSRFSSQQILLMIYIGCTIIFTPIANIQQVSALNSFQLGCLIFCCLNTIIAYGTYGEALNRWDISKVSAIMTQIPIFTIIFTEILSAVYPQLFVDQKLNWISYLGAITVVSGSLLSVLGHKLPSIFHRKNHQVSL